MAVRDSRTNCVRNEPLILCKEHLLQLTDAYKERIFTKPLELVLTQMAKLDRDALVDKTAEKALVLIYPQGVSEALGAFNMGGLLGEITRADAKKSGLKV